MKLDRKQEISVLYHVCVFSGRSEKQDSRPGLWLAEIFSTSPLKLLKGLWRNLTGSKNLASSTKFVFSGQSENQDRRPGLWLAETFLTSPLKPLNGIWRYLIWSKNTNYLQSLCFWSDQKATMTARPLIGWDICGFSSENVERNEPKLVRKQEINVNYQVGFWGRSENKASHLGLW